MKRYLLSLLPSLALLAVLAIPSESFAQVRIGGGGISIGGPSYGRGGFGFGGPGYYGRGGSGFGFGGPGYYGRGYGSGFGYGSGYGFGPGVSFGRSGISLNLGSGYGYGSYPRYSYAPGYGYNSFYQGYAQPYQGYAQTYQGYAQPYQGYAPSYMSGSYTYPSTVVGADYQQQGTIVGGTSPSGYQSFYPAGDAGQQNDGTRATIRVNVPPDAQVLFNGTATKQTGPQRTFISPPLDQNNNYSYEVAARWTENGREVNRSRIVRFQAGKTVDVDFTAAEGSNSREDVRPQGTNPQELSPRQDERPQQLNPGQNPESRPNPANPAPRQQGAPPRD